MQFAAFFFGEEMPFPTDKTNLKIVARWPYDWCANVRGNLQNLRKLVQSLCAPLRPFRSELKENFYHIILWMCTLYKFFSLPHYSVPQKTVKFVLVVPYQKCTVWPTFVCTESLLSHAIFKNVFQAFCRGSYVVVHPC